MAKKQQKLKSEEIEARGGLLFRKSVIWRSDKIDKRWKSDSELYNGVFAQGEKTKSDNLTGQGRLFIPKTYSHVQRILVDVIEAVMPDMDDIVSVKSWKNIPLEVKETVKSLISYRLNGHPINFYAEAYEIILDALKHKIGIVKVYPTLQYDEFGNITYFCPNYECIPFDDVYVDPRATWKDYYKYPIIHRMVKSMDYLKRRGYKNLDRINFTGYGLEGDNLAQFRNDSQSPFNNDITLKDSNSVIVYELWDFIDINNDGLLESCSYLMAGDVTGPKILIRDIEENTLPFKFEGEDYARPPIIIGQSLPEPHTMYGKCYPEITESLQKETNALRNQRREAVALALRKPILASRSSGIDIASLINRRIGGVVMGDDISPQSVRELNISDPTGSVTMEQQKTDQDFYETTSIPPNMLGMPASSDETATAVTSHIANANKKISQTIRNLIYTVFLPSFNYLLRLEQEYETDEFINLVTSRMLGWGIASDNLPAKGFIQGDFDLVMDMGINKQTQLNKLMMIIDRGIQSNGVMAQLVQTGVVQPQDIRFFNPNKSFELLLKTLGEKDTEAFSIAASQPPQQPGAEAPAGIGSQPRLPVIPEAAYTNMNPEAIGV